MSQPTSLPVSFSSSWNRGPIGTHGQILYVHWELMSRCLGMHSYGDNSDLKKQQNLFFYRTRFSREHNICWKGPKASPFVLLVRKISLVDEDEQVAFVAWYWKRKEKVLVCAKLSEIRNICMLWKRVLMRIVSKYWQEGRRKYSEKTFFTATFLTKNFDWTGPGLQLCLRVTVSATNAQP